MLLHCLFLYRQACQGCAGVHHPLILLQCFFCSLGHVLDNLDQTFFTFWIIIVVKSLKQVLSTLRCRLIYRDCLIKFTVCVPHLVQTILHIGICSWFFSFWNCMKVVAQDYTPIDPISWRLKKYKFNPHQEKLRVCSFTCLLSIERSCDVMYRRIGRVSWKAKKTNKEVLNKLGLQSTKLMTVVRQRIVRFYGHVRRHDSLQRIITEGMVNGKRGRGRKRCGWLGNVSRYSGMNINRCAEIATNREEWRTIVISIQLRVRQGTAVR